MIVFGKINPRSIFCKRCIYSLILAYSKAALVEFLCVFATDSIEPTFAAAGRNKRATSMTHSEQTVSVVASKISNSLLLAYY